MAGAGLTVGFATLVRAPTAAAPHASAPALISHHVSANSPKPVLAAYSTGWLDANSGPDLPIRAQSAIVVDLDSKKVVWARDPHSVRAPASLTKLITAMVAADLAPMGMEVTVPAEAAQIEPDVMGLSEGEVVTLETLFYGLFLDSGNDAAETLSRTLVPRDRFLQLMNQRAARLGMRDTHFSNPTGLDDPDLHASAYDLAVAAGELTAHYPKLAAIAATREQPIAGTAQHKAYDPYNLNKMLWTYPGATGLKTGFTDLAGGCVVVTATRDGRHLLAVVMNDDIFFTDAGKLLDYGWSVRPA